MMYERVYCEEQIDSWRKMPAETRPGVYMMYIAGDADIFTPQGPYYYPDNGWYMMENVAESFIDILKDDDETVLLVGEELIV